jgi:DNA-binding Xre family transcriptional regulator
MFAGNSILRLAVAVHYLFVEEAVTFDRVAVSFAAGHGVDTEANHADFGAKGFGVLYRPAKVCGLKCEHLSSLHIQVCRRVRRASSLHDCVNRIKYFLTLLCKFFSCDIVRHMITRHVREVAEKRGIKNAHGLQLALEVSPTAAAKLWKGEFEMIGLVTLDRLCRVLRCKPGDLLKYEQD